MASDIPPSGGSAWSSWFAANATIMLAGFVGGVIRAITTKEMPLWQRIATVITGCAFSLYGTPVFAPIARSLAVRFGAIDSAEGFSNGSMEGLVGLLLGLIGFSLFDGLVELSRRWRDNPAEFWPWRRR